MENSTKSPRNILSEISLASRSGIFIRKPSTRFFSSTHLSTPPRETVRKSGGIGRKNLLYYNTKKEGSSVRFSRLFRSSSPRDSSLLSRRSLIRVELKIKKKEKKERMVWYAILELAGRGVGTGRFPVAPRQYTCPFVPRRLSGP